MPAVRVHGDVLGRGDLVVRGEHRRRRADAIHQARAEQAFGADPPGQQRAVDVPQGVQRSRDEVDVLREEIRHLGVGRVRGQSDRALDVAQERDVRMADPDLSRARLQRGQRRGGQRERAALAGAAHRDTVRVGVVQPGGRLDGARRVHEQPGEVVVLGAGEAPGQHGRVLRAGCVAGRVAGHPGAPPPALAPGVHDQDRVSRRRQRGVLGGGPAAAAVADELHHHRDRLPAGTGRAQIPAADPVAVRAGELDVVHVERPVDPGLVPGEPGRPGRGAGLGEPARPPAVQAVRLGGPRPVLP